MSISDTYRVVGSYRLGGNTHGLVSSLSTAQTIAVPSGAVGVLLQAETQNVRVRFDGVNPTAGGTGFVVVAGGDPMFYPVSADMGIRAIEESASAELQYLFFVQV